MVTSFEVQRTIVAPLLGSKKRPRVEEHRGFLSKRDSLKFVTKKVGDVCVVRIETSTRALWYRRALFSDPALLFLETDDA